MHVAKTEMTQTQLVTAVKALLEKGDQAKEKAEQYYISAGQHLKTMKEGKSRDEFLELVKAKIGIGRTRVYELIAIADKTKTLEETRTRTNERQREHAKRSREARETLSVTNGQKQPSHLNDGLSGGGVRDLTVQPQEEPEDDYDTVDHDPPDVIWRRALVERATKAIEGAEYFDDLTHLHSVSKRDVDVVRRAAEAWSELTTKLENLRSKKGA